MTWHDTVVSIASRDQDGRVELARFYVVHGGISVEEVEFLFAVRGISVFADPEVTDAHLIVAHHVDDRDVAEHRAEEIGALHDAGGDEQSAVASTFDRQAVYAGVFLLDEILGRGFEVIERALAV